MPQMAPMNWSILYMFFIMLFMLIIFLNFYSFKYSIKLTCKNLNNKKINWKW